MENKRIIVNRVLSFSWKHQLHLQIPETQAHQWNRNNSFQYASKNLITSNSWNLFTTVIWNINYDNVLTSFVMCFSKAWQFSFWSWCNICFVTWRISLLFFLMFCFLKDTQKENFVSSSVFVDCFPLLPHFFFLYPLLFQEEDFSSYTDSWCYWWLNVVCLFWT